ncbi:hypothetical protein [Flexivirga meconopsidis]|uniref:hypothetical protein n=1 Tax=Flexivirga meconopsidis TaxID=2977121 RepID=UPI0022400885|nr:hypothetical protein [Flexivirga meconopsidis]
MNPFIVLDPLVHLLYVVLLPLIPHAPAILLIAGITLLARLALHPLMRKPGLLTLVAQVPIFGVVYRLFTAPVIAGQHNLLLDQTLLGAPMSAHLLSAGWPAVFVLLGVLACIAAVGWLTVLDARANPAPLKLPDDQPAEVAAAMERMQRVTPYLSLGSVLFAAFMPLAAMLYLLTSSTWSLLERRHLRARSAAAVVA